jgi:IS5 family transposase
MRPSHPVRHFWPLRNQRFFCKRLRSRTAIGNAQAFDVRRLRCRLVFGGVEAGVRRHGSNRLKILPSVRVSPRKIVVLRLLFLKHVRNSSYDVLEREVLANLVYRNFTRVGFAKIPGRQMSGSN